MEDLSALVGTKDNTVLKSLVNKVITLKESTYEKPRVIFDDMGEYYRITFDWKDIVPFNYKDDIDPVISMMDERLKDFSFTGTEVEREFHTVISFDVSKESYLHVGQHLSKRKRTTDGKVTTDTFPTYKSLETDTMPPRFAHKKRRTKSNGSKLNGGSTEKRRSEG